MIIIKIILIVFKDLYRTFTKLTMCESFDIMEIIGFGLIINAIYGVFKLQDRPDFLLLFVSLYGTLKTRDKKEKRC